MSFTEYIAQENDRFDTVAWKAYGDVSKTGSIVAANPQIGIVEGTIPAGTIVKVPVIDVPPTPTASLPHWK